LCARSRAEATPVSVSSIRKQITLYRSSSQRAIFSKQSNKSLQRKAANRKLQVPGKVQVPNHNSAQESLLSERLFIISLISLPPSKTIKNRRNPYQAMERKINMVENRTKS